MEFKVLLTITIIMATYMIVGGIVFQKIETSFADHSIIPSDEVMIHVPVEGDSTTPTSLHVDDVRRLLYKTIERLSALQTQEPWELEISLVDWETALANGHSPEDSDSDQKESGHNGTSDEQQQKKVVVQTTFKGKQISYNQHWSLYDAIFFAQTVVTTVGYGSIAPKTSIGRAISCIYAVLGIPVIGVWMAGVGELIFSHVEKLRKKVHIKKRLRTWFLLAHFIAIVLTGSVVFIIIPSFIFSIYEGWSYVDGVYYSVMSLTTVGLGDLVAGTKEESPVWYRVFLNCWLMLGLGWLSMIISLIMHMMRSRATKVINKASQKVAFQIKHRLSLVHELPRTMSFAGTRDISVFVPEVERSHCSFNKVSRNRSRSVNVAEIDLQKLQHDSPDFVSPSQRTISMPYLATVDVNEVHDNNATTLEKSNNNTLQYLALPQLVHRNSQNARVSLDRSNRTETTDDEEDGENDENGCNVTIESDSETEYEPDRTLTRNKKSDKKSRRISFFIGNRHHHHHRSSKVGPFTPDHVDKQIQVNFTPEMQRYHRSKSTCLPPMMTHHRGFHTPVFVYDKKIANHHPDPSYFPHINSKGIIERVEASATVLRPRCPSMDFTEHQQQL